MALNEKRMSRRQVCTAASSAAVCLALSGCFEGEDVAALSTTASANLSLAGMTTLQSDYNDWKSAVGADFTLDTGVSVRLSDVRLVSDEGPRPMPEVRQQPFELIFAPLENAVLPSDRIVRFVNQQIGTFDFFITGENRAFAFIG